MIDCPTGGIEVAKPAIRSHYDLAKPFYPLARVHRG